MSQSSPQSYPTRVSFFSDTDTPVSLFHRLSEAEPTACLLESTDGDSRLARFSIIGIAPIQTVKFEAGKAYLTDCLTGETTQQSFENPLRVLEAEQKKHLSLRPAVEKQPDSSAYPFTGGWIGYMGYGATRYFDNIEQQTQSPHKVPDGIYAYYDSVVLFDHLYRRITFLSYRESEAAQLLWADLQQRLESGRNLKPLFYEATPASDESIFESVKGPFTEETFCQAVETAKDYINEGQVFQIVLSHRFSQTLDTEAVPPLNVYRVLQAINPSPYSYYLKYPDFVYLGSSPETYIQCLQGRVMLRALAGTRPRGSPDEEDNRLAEELRGNEKELAEHYMLVDLGRNDLGKVCQTGSIQVGEIATLTRYSHVMHLATELTGQLRPDKNAYDVFQCCFPRGTVSGAPKIRAMQLLAKMEPEQRGIYSGVVGYFDNEGNMDGAIAIRSTLIQDGQAHVNAGAGVVFDSDPLAEYHETRNKAKSILKALQIAKQVSQ